METVVYVDKQSGEIIAGGDGIPQAPATSVTQAKFAKAKKTEKKSILAKKKKETAAKKKRTSLNKKSALTKKRSVKAVKAAKKPAVGTRSSKRLKTKKQR